MADTDKVDFRVLFDSSPGLLLVLDQHLFIVAVTDSYLRATMMRREDIVGQHLFDVFPDNPDDATGVSNLRKSLERVIRNKTRDEIGVQRFCIRGAGDELEERYWSPVNSPILGPDGRVKYIVHCVEDVTEVMRLKSAGQLSASTGDMGPINQQLKITNEELAARSAQLNDALQTMETFTYSIAHDLRAPLRALVSFSTLLREEYAETLQDRAKDYLRRITDAASRMDKLINDLLVYGRLTHVEPTALPISLDDAVTNVLRDISSELTERKAEVNVERPLPNITGSAILLNHVLANVIDNAVKFVPPDRTPRIEITSALCGDHIRLDISDNGIGIAPAYHGQIFDLFVRLHKSSEYSGTGVGLALVKKAMERMMGKVSVASTPGRGTCFSLEFRAAYNPSVARAVPAQHH